MGHVVAFLVGAAVGAVALWYVAKHYLRYFWSN